MWFSRVYSIIHKACGGRCPLATPRCSTMDPQPGAPLMLPEAWCSVSPTLSVLESHFWSLLPSSLCTCLICPLGWMCQLALTYLTLLCLPGSRTPAESGWTTPTRLPCRRRQAKERSRQSTSDSEWATRRGEKEVLAKGHGLLAEQGVRLRALPCNPVTTVSKDPSCTGK